MVELNQETIRALAHQLWERDECPDRREGEYWHAAVKRLSDECQEDNSKEPVDVMPIPSTRI